MTIDNPTPSNSKNNPKHSPRLVVHQETGSYLGSLWQVLAALCFTIMGILVKIATQKFHMHEYELVFWRVIFAVVVLGVQALLLGQSFKTAYPVAHFWRSLAGTVSLLMFFYGIAHLPLATAITFSYTSSIFLAVLSVVILKQLPSRLTWIALVLGFVGIMMLLRPTIVSVGVVPSLIGLCSGLVAGYAYLQVRELSLLGEPTWRIVFYFSALASIGAGLATTFFKGWTAVSLEALPYLLGIGLSAVAGQMAMTHAYKVGRKFMVASLSYLVVVLSAIYGAYVLGEMLGIWAILGIVLIVASGVLAGKK